MSDPAVQASHLGKAFGTRQVLDDLSFEVAPGDVIGVLGKNGAGKTTLLELMLGFTPPTAGTVSVFGQASQQLSAGNKARVGFVPQQDELIDQLSGRGSAQGHRVVLPALGRRVHRPALRRMGSESRGAHQEPVRG
jgi:ABC-2 type transport system ATP-binding protein